VEFEFVILQGSLLTQIVVVQLPLLQVVVTLVCICPWDLETGNMVKISMVLNM